VPVIQEFLRVGKRQAAGGTVHVHTHVERQPVQETVTLREEHVVAERRRVDRPLTEQDQRIIAAGDAEITIPTRVEVPVVAKEARVVEEVVLKKEVDERRAVIKDEVRRTEVDVDRSAAGEPGTRK
jgi:stress response protein YsnF